MIRSRRAPRRALLLALLAAGVMPPPAGADTVIPPFYQADAATVQGAPGSLIRSEALPDAPDGATAYRLLYRSQAPDGSPIAVSAVALVPIAPAPAGGRPIVAWAHPTSGVEPQCAPSRARSRFREIQGLAALLAQGNIVVATDYPGLGTAAPHPYLVGISEGRAVLDSVRAAALLPNAHAGHRYALWGHSQGGHAALFAAQLATGYLPGYTLAGVAVAAPATQLDTLLRDDANSDGGRNITAMTLWSWHRVYGLPLGDVLDPSAAPAMDALARECIETAYDLVERKWSGRSLKQAFLSVPDIASVEPWKRLLRENIPGLPPPQVPLFIAQGQADTLVRPAVTEAYRQQACAQGTAVRWLSLPKVGHGFIARDSAAQASQWIGERLAGQPAPDDCQR
ncbi:MAG: alpha/beta fold hydrolase [Stenotrophomonas sp.]